MLHEVQSEKNIAAVVETLKAELIKKEFGVLWEINFKDKFAEKGLEYKYNYYSFSVCNPNIAVRVLEKEQDLGHFLPCKISVYETDQGVKLGLVKPTIMMESVSSDVEVKNIAKVVEDTLIEVIEKSK